MPSETVRIKPATHDKLRELAAATGQSMPEVLDEAVEALRRVRLLNETNRAFAAMRKNPKAWKSELAERGAWEATLGDDLEER